MIYLWLVAATMGGTVLLGRLSETLGWRIRCRLCLAFWLGTIIASGLVTFGEDRMIYGLGPVAALGFWLLGQLKEKDGLI